MCNKYFNVLTEIDYLSIRNTGVEDAKKILLWTFWFIILNPSFNIKSFTHTNGASNAPIFIKVQKAILQFI